MREYVRDRERLEHIVEAIDRILAFTEGKTKEELVFTFGISNPGWRLLRITNPQQQILSALCVERNR